MESKKLVSVLVPCFNEQENILAMSAALVHEFESNLPEYDYEIVFIDNSSTDDTRSLLRKVCSKNPRIKAIFNAKNFGQFNSPYYGLQQTSGDCVILMCCDFQDPIEMIPRFLAEWEKGHKVVCGIKATSKENPFFRALRTCYYKLIRRLICEVN